jgi:outer membrane protein TolC
MNNLLILLLLVGTLGSQALAQEPESLRLQEVVGMAQLQSPAYLRTRTTYENNYWRYRNFKAGMLPQLTAAGTIPNLNRSIESITLPDGTDAFVDRSLATSAATLSLSQNVPFTGGRFSLLSSLQRIDLLGTGNGTTYLGTPFSLSYFQDNIFYNRFRWERQTEPLRYQESERQYAEQMEEIALEATRLFFDLLLAENNHQLALINLNNTDTLYKISEGRYTLGKIAENDLLQIELSLLNARNRVAETQLDLEMRNQDLKRYLNLANADEIELVLPEQLRFFEVEPMRALELARSNRAAVLEFRRRRLEAEQMIAQSRGDNGVQLGVSANFGLTQRGATLGSVYVSPQDQQTVALTMSIPLINWVVTRSRIRMAEANRDLVEVNVQQEEINFEQEILLQVMRFNMLKDQLLVAAKADTIAQRRFNVTKERYLIGKISITDLNLAVQEKDLAKQAYINMLRTYWQSYYLLRRLTLYDFDADKQIALPDIQF